MADHRRRAERIVGRSWRSPRGCANKGISLDDAVGVRGRCFVVVNGRRDDKTPRTPPLQVREERRPLARDVFTAARADLSRRSHLLLPQPALLRCHLPHDASPARDRGLREACRAKLPRAMWLWLVAGESSAGGRARGFVGKLRGSSMPARLHTREQLLIEGGADEPTCVQSCDVHCPNSSRGRGERIANAEWRGRDGVARRDHRA